MTELNWTDSYLWGESKSVKTACAGSLAPRFVNSDYVTAELICSTAHACLKVLTWSQATLWSMHMWAPPTKGQHYCSPREERRICLLLLLPRQPGETLCYGRRTNLERINVSAVLMAPWVFLQPLSSHLACPRFSEQYEQSEQRDNVL